MLRKAFTKNLSSLPSRSSLLTAIHRTSNLLPRVLADHAFPSAIELPPFESLDQPPPPARITVFGIDQWAGTEQLVTALLEQPFLPDNSLNKAIRSRWDARQDEKITITYGEKIQWQGSTLYIPSSFLLQFPFPVEIEEYAYKHEKVPTEAWFNSDVPVVLCNPVTTSLPVFPLKNPNAIRVLTSSIPIRNDCPSRTLFVDPLRALDGLSALHEDPHSPLSVQRYQYDYVGSRVPTLTSHIKNTLVSPGTLELLRTRRLTTQLIVVFDIFSGSLDEAEKVVKEKLADISDLRENYELGLNQFRSQILGIYDPSVLSSKQDNLVAKALTASQRHIQAQMDRLTWWKMISHIDEINVVVNRIVDEAWCKDLEHHLIFQTGNLSSYQHKHTHLAFDSLTPFSAFDSAVLRNSLEQISSSQSYKVTPSSLTLPIHSRKSQIAQYPTIRLHLAAQRAAIGTGFSVFTGMGLGWAGWVGWLTGSGEGLLGLVAIDATTSIGFGMLIVAAGIRWSVGKWERAKKAWWGDWYRVGEGLERDLSATLDRVLTEQVTVLSRTACEGISDIAAKTKEDIEELRDELKSIQSDFEKSKSV
ncbi:hypothetical protein J3R30DRAFT_3559331 [Lentinula aciculospora]|uniref:Transmembrane protein n=1 Tax=Lentinula aciculospora TaxID=153920 RepID=A0A9W8ZXP1_9AGAR|nr:hypothetical protein J3R30DRAFT_3559331 [Lentinula aciculospora]